MTDREIMQQALEALEQGDDADPISVGELMDALRERLAQPEQEPVALPCCGYADASAIKWNPYNQVVQCHNCGQTYTAPPQRKPLTDEEIDDLSRTMVKGSKSVNWLCRAIEAAHGIKGEA